MSKKPIKTPVVSTKPKVGSSSATAKPKPGPSSASSKPKDSVPAVARASSSIGASALPVEKKVPTPIESNLKAMVDIIYDHEQNQNSCVIVIDESTRVCAFLRHRDVSFLNCLDVPPLQAERIRLALLASIRYGKPLVFDMMDSENTIEIVQRCCAELDPKLFDEICDRSILKDERFMRFVKESDGDQYKSYNFLEEHTRRFKTVFLISKDQPSDRILQLGTPYKIV